MPLSLFRQNRRIFAGHACRLACVLAFSLLFAACTFAPPLSQRAYADVRMTDNLAGITVENRGVSAALCPTLDAERAILIDDTGKIWFERDADTQQRIASVTKIMTAIVALEYAPLDTQVTVTSEAAAIGESSAGLQQGDTMTLEQALNGLLISSGNDAAIAISDSLGALMLAEATSSAEGASAANPLLANIDPSMDNVEAFVSAMNAKAAELGMTNSLFANAHGLDIGDYDVEMYSTARDVATISAYAMQNEVFRGIVSKDAYTMQVKKADGATASIDLKSTDRLIGSYEGACGIKTGYTESAGYCFAGACEREGQYLYAVILNSSSEFQRFDDAKALYEWYYGNWVDYELAQSDVYIPMSLDEGTREVPVVAEVSHKSWLDKTVQATLADPDATVKVFAFNGNVSQEISFQNVKGTVRAGDKVGTITYYQHNEVIATAEMVAAETVAAPGPLETLSIAWDRLWLGIKGEPDCAASVVLNQTPLIYSKAATVS